MLTDLQVDCPPELLAPTSFNSTLAVGVLHAARRGTANLWIVINIVKGRVVSLTGMLGEDEIVPDTISALNPDVVAVADRIVWRMLHAGDRDSFYKNLEAGEVKISGDFRFFGRYTMLLIEITERAELWGKIDRIVAQIIEANKPTDNA